VGGFLWQVIGKLPCRRAYFIVVQILCQHSHYKSGAVGKAMVSYSTGVRLDGYFNQSEEYKRFYTACQLSLANEI
jgi:hypothetical protein